jgi:hypothetical protein
MASDNDPPRVPVPDYRPVERFWPYVDLPEQPSDEELAALSPELSEALFGTPKLPFSVTLDFPVFDGPDYARAVAMAKKSVEYRELGSGAALRPSRPLLPERRHRAQRSLRHRRALRRDRRADRRSAGAVRARAVAAR